MPGTGTRHAEMETVPVQFLQQDEPRLVLGWRVETTAIQSYAAMHCFQMTADEWVEVAELPSTQEEADIRLLLDALHASITGSKAVIVTADDTDVMLLCLLFQNVSHVLSHVSEVWDTEPHTIC